MTKDDDHISLVQSGYDQIAESYHERRVSRKDANVVFLDSLKDKLPPHGKVLDMGCGGGVPISQYFAERGYEVTGFDISEEMIALAKQAVPQAKFFVQDMQTVTFGEKEFALIVSFFAIIHVPREHHASSKRCLNGSRMTALYSSPLAERICPNLPKPGTTPRCTGLFLIRQKIKSY
jgi:2-polyprenyl-3-methyl-5-hydroxy-6-metoxy-1,4-benzoquinol methylase